MKLLILLLLPLFSHATNYFVSAAGSDAANGTSSGTAWQTVSKVNSSFSSFVAGDTIKFRCGDTFTGGLTAATSGSAGNPIVFYYYSTGAPPIITGLSTLSSGSWTTDSSNIRHINCSSCGTTVNNVFASSVRKNLGRYPASGYVNITATNGTTSVTIDAAEPSAAFTWTKGDMVIRNRRWIISRNTITAQSTNVFTVTQGTTYTSQTSFGCFFQNAIPALISTGNWSYNADNKNIYYRWASTTPTDIQVSTVDYLVNITSFNYLTFIGLNFTGANINSFLISVAHHITITNCNLSYAGQSGIYLATTHDLTFTTDTITNNYSSGIEGHATDSVNSVTYCQIKNNGTVAGLGGNIDGTYSGIYINGSNNTVSHNRVDTSGYTSIHCLGDANTISYDTINYHDFVKDDGGAIYTYIGGLSSAISRASVISNNIVSSGIGAAAGTSNTANSYASGVYLDDNSNNYTISNNKFNYNSYAGFYCHNCHEVTYNYNLEYLDSIDVLLTEDNLASGAQIRNLTVTNNLSFTSLSGWQTHLISTYLTNSEFANFGTINNNRFWTINSSTPFKKISSNGSATYNLANWTAAWNFDATSTNSDVKNNLQP